MWLKKRLVQGFSGVVSPNLDPALDYHCSFMVFWRIFVQTHNSFLLVYLETPRFWVKLCRQIFPDIRP